MGVTLIGARTSVGDEQKILPTTLFSGPYKE